MDQKVILTRGGVYLAKLNPVKTAEIGKIRPVVIFSAQAILEVEPPIVFICPLSSRSDPEFSSLHVELPLRDNLKTTSYALVEHCRSISVKRLVYPRLTQLTSQEITLILHRLQKMIGL